MDRDENTNKRTFFHNNLLILTLFLSSQVVLAKDRCNNTCLQPSCKLSPHVRIEDYRSLSAIPYETIKAFLKESIIIERGIYHHAPYIVALENDRTEASRCSILFVHQLPCNMAKTFSVYRRGKTYRHPCTKELLGFEADKKGTAELVTHCEPAVLKVIESNDGIEVGDRILPDDGPFQPKLIPKPARVSEIGYILAAKDHDDQIGKHEVVVLSLGTREGLFEGDVLDIYKAGKNILDPVHHATVRCLVKLPNTRIGCLLVFKTYEKLSLGLVLEATEVINLLDKVKRPQN